MDKATLKETWNRLVTWKKVNFPSRDTLTELRKQGWGHTTLILPAYNKHGATFPVRYPVTPEGKPAFPGTPEFEYYQDAIRDILAGQDDQHNTRQDIKPSP